MGLNGKDVSVLKSSIFLQVIKMLDNDDTLIIDPIL